MSVPLGNTSIIYTEIDSGEIISDEVGQLTMRILMYLITPAISAFGVLGNMVSIPVLVKHGVHKSSNILLINLAITNTVYLIAFNSVPKILYEAVQDHQFVGVSESEARVLFVFFSVFTFFDYSFGLMALSLPMLITLERLFAVFCPMSFHRIITSSRTWIVVVIVAVYWISIFVYSSFWLELKYVITPQTNTTSYRIVNSQTFEENPEAVVAVENLFIYTSSIIPPIFTATGCVAISLKLKSVTHKRKAMTSNSKASSRTTKTLLAVCFLYVVTSAVTSVPMFIPQYASYSLTDEAPTNLSKILYQLLNIIGCINSSSDFLVYIVFNKKFRHILLALMKGPSAISPK
ncbi:FMRFamide receptor-like [Physella acuta]|uniref:FMRFamide receptor-like n=1 Tax=Physella acuta TaxID=109671 RepID=UPI0027DB005A|nr:FMRFamide receptor-like [Physella acuta]